MTITVTITDPNNTKKTRVELPDHILTGRLLEALVPRLNLPVLDQSGQPISYRLVATRDGDDLQINPDETLAAASVQDGDMLRLSAEMRGGGC